MSGAGGECITQATSVISASGDKGAPICTIYKSSSQCFRLICELIVDKFDPFPIPTFQKKTEINFKNKYLDDDDRKYVVRMLATMQSRSNRYGWYGHGRTTF